MKMKNRKLLNIITQIGGVIIFILGYNLAEWLDNRKNSKGA